MAYGATDLPPVVIKTPRTITERLCDFMIDTATGKSWTELGRTFDSYKESTHGTAEAPSTVSGH